MPGLLDLGYVAFFAAGAYVAGWFASQQFGGGLHSPRSWIFGGTVPQRHARHPPHAVERDPDRRAASRRCSAC